MTEDDPLSEVHISVVHAVPGFTALPGATVKLLAEANASVWLTCEPDELAAHVDRKNALAELLLKGAFHALDTHFATALASAREHRQKEARSSQTYLIADAHISARLEKGTTRAFEEFSVTVDALPQETREDLKRLADSAIGRVVSALSLTLGDARFPHVRKVAEAHYSVDQGSAKITYQLIFTLYPPTMYVSSPADDQLISLLKNCIAKLPTLGVETALRLYKIALEESDDELRSFVAAWAALEILVNKACSARLARENAHDEIGFVDRFGALATWLSVDLAKDDIELVARLNGARNDLYHRGILPPSSQTRDVLNLVRKYCDLLIHSGA